MLEPSAAPRRVRLEISQRFVREALADVLTSAGHQVLVPEDLDADVVLRSPDGSRGTWSLTAPPGHAAREVRLSEEEPLRDLLLAVSQGAVASSEVQRPPAPLLTPREREVLVALARHGTARAAAAALNISAKTVSNHKDNVFRKLGSQSLAHAVAVARRDGHLGA